MTSPVGVNPGSGMSGKEFTSEVKFLGNSCVLSIIQQDRGTGEVKKFA